MHWIRENDGLVHAARDRPGEDRLRGSGNVLEQDVPSGYEPRQHEPDLLALAVDDDLQVVDQPPGCFRDGLQAAIVWLHRSL